MDIDRSRLAAVLDEIDGEQLKKHMEYLGSFEKLSGEPEALKFVDYAAECLKQWEVPYEIERFPAYLSNPKNSRLRVGEREFKCRPRSFGGNCPGGLWGEMVYDPYNWEKDGSPAERQALYSTFSGKIVVSHGFDERYGKILEHSGAKAWIQVWKSGEECIHEDTVSPVWGTPDLESCFLRLRIPVIAVSFHTGRELVELIREGGGQAWAWLAAENEEAVKEVALPVAMIGAQEADFVLLSCHYDTWYIGAFDNGCANAAALEIARVFHRHRNEMKRGLRIAWWPGHSNGRYMGSAWYCDHHWDELSKRCVACLNSDLIGAMGSDTLFVRTAGFEGREWIRSLAREAVKEIEPRFARIGRGADQSFFGCGIPYHMSPRLEAPEEGRSTAAPGGHDWWHTPKDTLDKVDFQVLRQDARILAAFTWAMLVQEELPWGASEFFERLDQELQELEKAEKCVRMVQELRCLCKETGRRACEAYRAAKGRPELRRYLTVLVGGTLSRLTHSSGSPYGPDTAFAYGPLHLLGESGRMLAADCSEEQAVFAWTSFIRQRNRMVTELRQLNEKIRTAAESLEREEKTEA